MAVRFPVYISKKRQVSMMSAKKRYVLFFLALFGALCRAIIFPSYSLAAETITLESEPAGKKITLEWVVEPKYLWGKEFYAGVAWFQEKKNGPWKLIDRSGKTLVDGFQAETIGWYSADSKLASFRDCNGLRGYVDLAGKVAISPQYEKASLFVDGVAEVGKTINGELLYGIIDRNGKTVLPIRHKRVEILHHNRFGVGKIGEVRYVDEKGKTIVNLVFEGLDRFPLIPGACIATLKGGKVGLLNEKGEWILPPEYSRIQWANEGPIAVTKDGKAGYVDMNGNTVIDFRFRGTSLFSEGLAVVSSWEKGKPFTGIIDKKGNLLFKYEEENTGYYSHGFLLVRDKGRTVGLIDREGRRFWLPSYIRADSFTGFSEGILLVFNSKTQRYGCLRVSTK